MHEPTHISNADKRNVQAYPESRTLLLVLCLAGVGIMCAELTSECSMTPEQRIERLEHPVVIP